MWQDLNQWSIHRLTGNFNPSFSKHTFVTHTDISSIFDSQRVATLLAQWREIDVQITEAANEAKDNVKYLSTLERFFDPLYANDPGAITDTLPGDTYTLYTYHNIIYASPSELVTGRLC